MTKKIKMLYLTPTEREKYPELLSLAQLHALGLRPAPNAKPRALVLRGYNYGNYYLYDKNKTVANKSTVKERAAARKYRKELAARKIREKREKEVERRRGIGDATYTAWQMLEYWHRIPRDIRKIARWPERWAYYRLRDSRKVTGEEFEKLKALYVELYGGWEHIDLENTKYNGCAWWPADFLDK